MFKVGDLVIYGNNGVCTVEEIGTPNFAMDSDELYYTLSSYYKNTRIFTPCENSKVVIRALITVAEVHELLDNFDDIPLLTVENERNREDSYKEVIKNCDPEETLGLLKTIHVRKKDRKKIGKKITSNDEKYMNIAKEKLYGELAIVLGIAVKNVESFIFSNCNGFFE